MENFLFEKEYDQSFRAEDVKILSDSIAKRASIELVGMKRVGINNFLRFFLMNKKQFLSSKENENLFTLVDLNDLIECELFSFWRLLLKRIVDQVEESNLPEKTKQKISNIFLRCIQSGDFFLTFDGVKEIISTISKNNTNITIFFTRFDRISEAVSLEFFNNLQSLKDAGIGKLSFIFTSFRSLSDMAPHIFDKNSLALFSKVHFIKPADKKDGLIMLNLFLKNHKVKIDEKNKEVILELSGGHAQYLQISSVILSEIYANGRKLFFNGLSKLIYDDERINLLSEELWESLNFDEKNILKEIANNKNVYREKQIENSYLWESGILNSKNKIFSPLFESYLQKLESDKGNQGLEFSKKEFLLYSILEKSSNEICEREDIVEFVWPEYKEYGVSDWSIDRLVARVRNKLKKQKNNYEIITIRTRGYKLVINQ